LKKNKGKEQGRNKEQADKNRTLMESYRIFPFSFSDFFVLLFLVLISIL